MRPVVEHRGSLSYLVQVANGVVWRRHVDHLRQTIDSPQEEETAVPDTNVDDSRLPPSSPSDEAQSSSLPAVIVISSCCDCPC